jgi:hypothetical protein
MSLQSWCLAILHETDDAVGSAITSNLAFISYAWAYGLTQSYCYMARSALEHHASGRVAQANGKVGRGT